MVLSNALHACHLVFVVASAHHTEVRVIAGNGINDGKRGCTSQLELAA